MGHSSAAAVTAHRPRWRSYLLLARVSNLPTVWSNVLAGIAAAQVVVEPRTFLLVAASCSLFYAGGMLLNDAFDAEFDRRFRPERPIPAGDIERQEVFVAGGVLLAVGELALAAAAWPAAVAGVLLAIAILAYDYSHKGSRVASFVMGSCRALVYCVAGVAATGTLPSPVIAGAIIMGVYVSGLTMIAKVAGPHARWLVPLLIAAISLVDATFIAVTSGSMPLAVLAASGFVLTLLLQRSVPGD